MQDAEGCSLDRDALLCMVENVRDGIYLVDPSRVIRFWSRGAERISGYTAAQVVGRPCGEFLMHCDERGEGLCGSRCPLQDCAARRCGVDGLVWMKHAQGARVPVYVSANPVLERDGCCAGMVEVFREASEELALVKRARELERQALLDPLTGAGNRRYTEQVLEQAWEAWGRYGTRFGVVMLDVDLFKRVNDAYGHKTGDEVLRSVARTMAANLRAFDFLGRWGGEEFLAVIQCVGVADLCRVAARCRELAGCTGVPVAGGSVRVTLSAGVAVVEERASPAEMVELADQRLYAAKNAGRNRLVGPVEVRAGASGGAERLAEAAPGDREFFGHDAGLADGGHEVGVAGPAREHVHMEVAGDAGAGALAEVHSKVEALGPVDFAQAAHGGLGEVHQFGGGLRA
jgi:diguanylate cyclase (GGDEF)-like protein/PAS domain S-box-containing protein